MSTSWVAALILVLFLLPGYSLLHVDCPRRLRLPFVVFASVIVTSALGLLLLVVGRFSVPLIAAIEAPLILIRIRSRNWPALELRRHLLVISLIAGLGAFFVLTSGEPFDATGDAGVYTISAQHLARTGEWTWPLDEVIPKEVPESLVVYEAPYVRPWREVAPGFIVRGDHVAPQFFPLFPVWGAIFGELLGLRGILGANLLGGLMLVLGCDALFHLFLGRWWRFAALAVVLLNPVFLVFLKYPSAEVFLAGILAGWLFWMVLFLRAPTPHSAAMPAALLALGVLTKFFAWAVAGAVVVALALLPWRRIKTGVVFLSVLMPSFVLGGWLAAPHLENHLGQLMILDGFKIMVIGCGGLLILRFLWSRLHKVVPRVLAAAYVAALALLWVLTEVANLRDFAELSGLLVVWGAAIGQCLYLWRRRASWLVFPAFIFTVLSLYLFLGSGDSPYYPFAARRYLPITVPVGALFVGYLARWLERVLRRLLPMRERSAASVIAGLALLAAVLPPLWTQRTAVVVRQGAGFCDTLTRLQQVIPDHRPVLSIGQAWRYSPHLLLSGQPVFSLDMGRRSALEEVDEFLTDHSGLLVLTDERLEMDAIAIVDERRRAIQSTIRPPLAAGRWGGASFRLLEVQRRRWMVPDRLDIGADDLLRVAGCYAPETAKGRSFRWTTSHARLLLGPGKQVRFVWSRGANPRQPLSVHIFARGDHVGDANLGEGWQTSRWFDIPVAEGPALVEIRSPTFQPALESGGRDRRNLGLRLDFVETR
jgi:hypothetical protein